MTPAQHNALALALDSYGIPRVERGRPLSPDERLGRLTSEQRANLHERLSAAKVFP